MRHYDRADLRHLNDSQRYRDYDYLADDGWPPAPEPLSMREMPATPSPPPPIQELASPPMWRLLLTALLNPRRTVRKALGRAQP
jgi:hypothetical protein